MTDRASYSDEMLEFCKRIPKVELHAHLNGCVRIETLRTLIKERGIVLPKDQLDALEDTGTFKLATAFKIFDVIHAITTTHEAITAITREVVEDFRADGVVYLELRTTPKNRPEHGMTKKSYVQAVIQGLHLSSVQEVQLAESSPSCPVIVAGGEQEGRASEGGGTGPGLPQRRPSILVKLLLSIDRREGHEAALQTVELAQEFAGWVVGIDLSGNPAVGEWGSWEPALARARELGLKITLHAGEIPVPIETAAMLRFRPDRLGHMCCLDEDLEARLKTSGIPVELCLTSNLKTSTVTNYEGHHFLPLYKAGCPVVLCTDDSGLFRTTVSQEYAIAARAFGLGREQLLQLAEASVGFVFASDSKELQWLRNVIGEGVKNIRGSA